MQRPMVPWRYGTASPELGSAFRSTQNQTGQGGRASLSYMSVAGHVGLRVPRHNGLGTFCP
jgi:hypothetical protein